MGRLAGRYGRPHLGGVEGARNLWNGAADTTSDPGTTHRPPYYFIENQGGGIPAAAIVIIKDTGVAYASCDKGGPPAYLRINPTWAASLTQEQLAAVFAHEVGHPLGLGNAYEAASDCQGASSIMNGLVSHANPVPRFTAVQDRDVFQMNRQFNPSTRSQCCADVAGNNTVYLESGDDPEGYQDYNDDGYGSGAACVSEDCNDSDPNIHEGCYSSCDFCGGGDCELRCLE
ncbi:MAG: hypothetical protein M3348_07120, partial [Acidobacteriota bacterium]|nr:hypothetical protein [Acidobacteriota bacterium]